MQPSRWQQIEELYHAALDREPGQRSAFLGDACKGDADLLISGHIPCDLGYMVPNDHQVILDALGTPAGYCLFPTDRAITHQELVEMVRLLP